MTISRRSFAAGAGALFLFPRCARAETRGGVLTPEMFGARGDGATNDSAALAALAARVNASGGGEIAFRPVTYLVGDQRPPAGRSRYSFAPQPLLDFRGCSAPLLIRGNGARLKCADGLRYGTFDPATGEPTRNKLPYTGSGQIATPYLQMINVEDCTGAVTISDIELDGNVARLWIGGEYGDRGRQIAAIGLALRNNRGSETIGNVHSHHHGADGLYIDGVDADLSGVRRLLTGVSADYNGRQGCSIVGGRGYAFRDCKFNHTGKAVPSSAPGAGVDIEAERGKRNRGFSFTNCEFSNNTGAGMVADSGDDADATFTGCTFIGTTNWAAWPAKPGFRFDKCIFVGAIVRCFGDADAARATQFRDCTFKDGSAASPTGTVFLGRNPAGGPIADLGNSRNVAFVRCTFQLTGRGLLPWSTGALYTDCVMKQASKSVSRPRGTFAGRNSIIGNADLTGSYYAGVVALNGIRKDIAPAPKR